jgi:hypothetical protein
MYRTYHSCRQPPGTWLRAIDFGCAQQVEEGVPLTRKTGTPMFMVRTLGNAFMHLHKCCRSLCVMHQTELYELGCVAPWFMEF